MTQTPTIPSFEVIIFTLSVLLWGIGLWGIGLLAHNNTHVRDLFSALFELITAFHGLFIFIMNGVRSKDVHTVWKQWFNQVTRQDFDHMTRKIVRFMDDKVSKSP